MKLLKKLTSAFVVLAMALTMLLPAAAATDETVPGSPDLLANRVVGYFPSYRTSHIDQIDYSALTHIVLSFITYNNGTFSFPFSASDIQRIKTHCEENGVKLMVALGGWDGFQYTDNPVDTAAERTVLVDQIMSIVNQYNLDGVDIDTEITDGVYWSNFDAFMSELSGRLKADGKLLTMAVSSWFTDPIANSTYNYFDFINLMSYDYSNSDVAPMSQVTSLINYYSSRGVSNDRMTIGVPFYGYDANHNAYTYAEIIAMSPDANNSDTYNGISYNGEATIRTKAEMSKSYGGIMIWEIGQDSFGEYLLLADIKDVMSEGGTISANVAPVTDLTATASSTTTVNLTWTASADAAKYEVYQDSTLLGTTSSTSYTAVGLSARTDYTFSVAAINADGESSKKVNVSVTTPAGSEGDYEIWDSTQSYAQNTYVIYDGKIYRAKWWANPGEVPGANDWNAWEYVGDVASSVEESIVISTSEIALNVGETTTISASVTPAGTAYTWSSSAPSVATVSDAGLITAVAAGTATITATSAGGKTASCTVTVSEETEPDPVSRMYTIAKIDSTEVYNNFYGVYSLDQAALIINNKAYVPMRNAANLLYAEIQDYDDATNSFYAVFSQFKVKMQIDSQNIEFYTSDGAFAYADTIPADQVPVLVNGKSYLPARQLASIASMDSDRQVEYVSDADGEFVAFIMGDSATSSEVLSMIETAKEYL